MRKIILIFLFIISIFSPGRVLCDDAVVLKYSTQIEVSEKKCIQTVSAIIQINNIKGDQFTNFRIAYSDNRKLKKLTGEIRDINNMIIRKLTKKDISTSSLFDNSTFYNDNFVKRFSLKHNRYPYIIEYEYQHEISPFLQIVAWDPIWDDEISTLTAELMVTFLPGYKFKTNTNNISEPEINETEEGKTYKWQSSYNRLKANDIFASSVYDSIPSVTIVPQYFNYIKHGSFETWKSYGEWRLSTDEGLDDLTDKEKAHIDQLTAGINDTQKLIAILYHYLQDNTRYILVDIDFGGLMPYPASYVCNNRFGDCKALTNYMKAMLAYKKIPSNKVYVSAGEISEKICTDFPSHQSNHVILAVPFSKDTIWLECTSNTNPTNYLGTFTQDRPAFWTESNHSRIVRTPALKKEEVTTITSYHFSKTGIDQKTKLVASFKLSGTLFETVISIIKNSSEKDKRDYFYTYLGFKNFQSEEYKIKPTDRDSSFIIFETNGSCNSPFQSVGEFTKVDLPQMSLPNFEKVKDRESPVKIYRPLAQIDTVLYDLESTSIKLTTENRVTVESIYGKFEMDLSAENGQLKVIRKFEIPVQQIALAQYKDFYDFIYQLNSKGESLFIKTQKN